MNWKLALLVVLVVAVGNWGWGQTLVSGDVSGDWTLAGSPYIVMGHCTVTSGDTLTIHPGVLVTFNGYYYLVAYGTLIAEGTASDSIVFTSNFGNPNPGDWRYVEVINPSAMNSRFRYCNFSYGDRGVYADNTTVNVRNCKFWQFSGRGIYTVDTDGEIRDCVIINSGRGMKIENGTVLVDHCSITGNDFAGISTSANAIVTIQYCNISDNTQQGIELTDGSSGQVLWNTILRNELDGIYVAGAGDTVFVDRNVVAGNQDGVYISIATVIAWNNTITQNDLHGVFFYNSHLRLGNCIVDRNGNSGVYCQSSTYWFFYNDVWDNTVGDYNGCLPGAGCFSDDPEYVNPSSGGNGDYHLLETSPCIDTGYPFSALDPDGTRADVGAYYYNQLGVPNSKETVVPEDVWLGESYPNPFNESTVIPFRIYHAALVKIVVYDVLGREVAVLFNQWAGAGENQVLWEAEGFPSGIYYIILQSSNVTRVQKVVRLK